jgi:hypothetical protein
MGGGGGDFTMKGLRCGGGGGAIPGSFWGWNNSSGASFIGRYLKNIPEFLPGGGGWYLKSSGFIEFNCAKNGVPKKELEELAFDAGLASAGAGVQVHHGFEKIIQFYVVGVKNVIRSENMSH